MFPLSFRVRSCKSHEKSSRVLLRLREAKEEKEKLRFAVLRLLRAGPEKDLEKNLAAVMKDLCSPRSLKMPGEYGHNVGMCAGCERVRAREDSGCDPED